MLELTGIVSSTLLSAAKYSAFVSPTVQLSIDSNCMAINMTDSTLMGRLSQKENILSITAILNSR